jgi:hypothetical protein
MLHWTRLVAKPWAVTSIGFLCLFAIISAIGWFRKRLWLFRMAGFLAVAGFVAGFALSNKQAQYAAPPSQPKSAVQETNATANLQPASQVITSTLPTKQELPFPEPVNPGASNSLAPRLWVASNSGEMTEYEASTFQAKQTVVIPADALPSEARSLPYRVGTNRKGQILVGPTFHGNSTASTPCTLWLWNGQSGSYLNCGNEHREETAPDNRHLLIDVLSRPILAADGEHLFWLVNEQQETPGDFEKDIMPSMTTKFHIWETDFNGGQRQEIASSAFPDCVCSTGACEESCPTAGIWTPKSGMDNFFGVYGWYAGQLGQSHYVGESLYRKSPDGQWSSAELPSSFENDILDAAEDASAFIILIPDSACCGWNNESDDQTLLLRKGQTIVLFDEFARYNNSQYDVNYSARDAEFSPDSQFVAMTISSSSRPGEEFRASDENRIDAKLSADVVEHINKTLVELPAVEVVTTTDSPKRSAYLPNTTFVGWLNEKEILIVKDSSLVAYDVVTGTTRKSNIPVGDNTFALVR